MIIGTTNSHKIREYAGLCAPLGLHVSTACLDIPETQDSFAGNAEEKAFNYSRENPGKYVLADDSGIVVPAIGDLPGPWSARFSLLDLETRKIISDKIPANIDEDNCNRLIELMTAVPESKRGASMVVSLVMVHRKEAGDPRILFQSTQRTDGWILTEKRGSGGFGYDCVFSSDLSFGKSWAEIDSARKGLISHRAQALRDFNAWLCSPLGADVV